MSQPAGFPSDQLSVMPMVCPLVKLGRSSPPNTDIHYHTQLESKNCHKNLIEPYRTSSPHTTIQHAEQNYNGMYHCSHPIDKHIFTDIYTKITKEVPTEVCPSKQHYSSKKESIYHPQTTRITNDQQLYSCKHRNEVHHQITEHSSEQYQYYPLNMQSSNYSSSAFDCEQQRANYYGDVTMKNLKIQSEYKSQTNTLELPNLSADDDYWSRISNKSSEQNEIICRHRDNSQDYNDHKRMTSPAINSCTYLVESFDKLGKSSPNLDQGYHTLVSPSPGSSTSNPWMDNTTNINLFKGKKLYLKNNSFDRLEDEIVLKIFSWLNSYDLSVCSRVCKRFENLAWRPSLWKTIVLNGEHISGDKAIRAVLRQLCGQGRTGACPNIERVYLSEGAKLTDRALMLLARRCPELTHLQLESCSAISTSALSELVSRCINLQHLDITGCTHISCISTTSGPEPPKRLLLQYLDMSDCPAMEDNDLRVIVRNCPLLVYLYLRRCVQLTDAGLKYVPSFCSGLRELSVSDCSKITDFGLYELAKLGATLRYLSVAKCDQVSDAGLKVIARRCYKLRYLNARGCEAVSDDAITVLARSCTRLRALDIGKCDVSDAGLRALAESCPNIKKLSLRSCDLVTDRGVQCIAYYCRGLQQLNIQDCQISLEGYRAVKKYCKRCVIEHTNPGFF